MNMISREEIDNLANLARLELDDTQKESLTKDLESILGYFEQLKEVEGLDKVEAANHVAPNVIREDKIINESNQKLVEAAPKHNGQYVRVKKIL